MLLPPPQACCRTGVPASCREIEALPCEHRDGEIGGFLLPLLPQRSAGDSPCLLTPHSPIPLRSASSALLRLNESQDLTLLLDFATLNWFLTFLSSLKSPVFWGCRPRCPLLTHFPLLQDDEMRLPSFQPISSISLRYWFGLPDNPILSGPSSPRSLGCFKVRYSQLRVVT